MPSHPVKLEIPDSAAEQLAYWMKARRRPACFVYVIQASGDAPIKVGVAKNPRRRIASLQTGNPRSLDLRAVLIGEEELERQLHLKLCKARVLGEWFDGPDVPAFIEYAQGLAAEMMAAYQATKKIPDWRDFGSWAYEKAKAPKAGAVTVSHVEPDPEWLKAMAARREREAEQSAFLDEHSPVRRI